MNHDYTVDLYPIMHHGFECANCGKPLKPGDPHLDCPDCAAIFCEDCVRDGTFENHRCDDYDWDDD